MLIQRQIRHDPLQARVLVAQLTQLLELRQSQLAVLLLPHIEARLADAQLTTHIRDRCTTFGLPQRVADLLLGKSRPLQVLVSPVRGPEKVSLVQF